ncbi:unnamed protein product [Lota lota]
MVAYSAYDTTLDHICHATLQSLHHCAWPERTYIEAAAAEIEASCSRDEENIRHSRLQGRRKKQRAPETLRVGSTGQGC